MSIMVSNMVNSERVVDSKGRVSYEKTEGFSDNVNLKFDEDANLSSLELQATVDGSVLAKLVSNCNSANTDKRPITVDPKASYYVAYNGDNQVDGLPNSIIFNKRQPESVLEGFDTSIFTS